MKKEDIQKILDEGVKDGKFEKLPDGRYKLTEKGRKEGTQLTGSPQGFLLFLKLCIVMPGHGKKKIDMNGDANTFINKILTVSEKEMLDALLGNREFLRKLQEIMQGKTVEDLLYVIDYLGIGL